jgi:hypothetical protein
VAPIPIGLLVSLTQPRKIVVFAMILLSPHAIGAVFVVIPLMIIIVAGVVVTPIVLLFLPLVVAAVALSLNRRRNCYGAQEGRAAKACKGSHTLKTRANRELFQHRPVTRTPRRDLRSMA